MTPKHSRIALLSCVLLAFAPLFLRLWRFATCGTGCGAGSWLGLFSDALTGSAFLALMLVCPRALRWFLALLWTLFQVGSQELYQAMQRYPVWQDLHHLLDADFVRNSTGNFKLAAPLFTAVLFLSAIATALVRLPRIRLRHLAWAVPALVVLFFAHARLETGSSHAVTANRNPMHNFVLDAAYGSQRSSESAAALPESLKHADLSGAPLLGENDGRAKNVLIVVAEGIPGLYIPEIRQAMGIQDNPLSMDKLAGVTNRAMLVPDFVAHSHQTIRGLYSILCGDFSKLSSDTPKPFELLDKPERAAACLPAQLAQHGWETHYLQGAGLSYMSKDRVMAQVGFHKVYGMEWFAQENIQNPFPYAWGAVDSAFFQGARRYIGKLQKGGKPWMLTLLTVGTHHPFGVSDAVAAKYPTPKDAAVAALDDALEDFLNGLNADGVLDDTLVIVTSDESHGSPRWDWVSSWGLNIVLAPGQNKLPRIKSGGYGLVDIEASILDYLRLPVPAQVIGRSFFHSYDTPREMLSFTNMVLRRHTDGVSIRCAGASTCTGFRAASILGETPPDMQEISPQRSGETYAIAATLDNTLKTGGDIRKISFNSGEKRKIVPPEDMGYGDTLTDGQFLDLPANSDVTVHLRVTLLEGPREGVPFRMEVERGPHIFLSMFDDLKPLPKIPGSLPMLRPGESMDKTVSFHNDYNLDRVVFSLKAEASHGLIRIDQFDVVIKRNHSSNSDNANEPRMQFSPLEAAALENNIKRAYALLEQGADVNAVNKVGITALMWAAFEGHADMVNLLLDKGANINAVSKTGETALSLALHKFNDSIAKTLVAKGANPNVALMPASWHGRVESARFLLAHGASINYSGGGTAQWTSLMHAVWHGRTNMVNFLLENAADVNIINNHGATALAIALHRKHFDIAKSLLAKGADPYVVLMPASWGGNMSAVRFLLEHGADVNHAGSIDTNVVWTPLMCAAYQGHKDLVVFLLDKGANVNVRGKSGETAFQLATDSGHSDIARILKEAGGA